MAFIISQEGAEKAAEEVGRRNIDGQWGADHGNPPYLPVLQSFEWNRLMSKLQPRLFAGLTANQAATDARSGDPRLIGRTYAISFEKVWSGALDLAGSRRGWAVTHSDDAIGCIQAEVTTLFFRFVDDVEIRIFLDENAQTRIDLLSTSRKGRADFGTNARRIGRFLKALDRKLSAGPDRILDPTAPTPWS